MLEYHGLGAAMKATAGTLEAAQANPLIAQPAADLAEGIRDDSDAAYLGAFVGPLLALSGAEPLELDLLRRAGALWRRGLKLAEELNTARIEFELSLARTDLPEALDVLQMGLNRLAGLHAPVKAIRDEVEALRAEIDKLDHIPRHPRQSDEPSSDWGWADLFAGRRGLAFVEAMIEEAQDRRGRAFAAGALAGYAGHVAGSAWLGSVVGGPRRLHRFRDRLARNTMGAALHDMAGTPEIGELGSRMSFEGREGPLFPPDLLAQLTAALEVAYPGRAVPDLAEAHQRLVEHLELLASFAVPAPPEPPPVVGDQSQAATIETQTFGQPDDPIPGGTVALGTDTDHDSPGISSQKDASGNVCIAVAVLIVTLGIAYLIWCIGRLTDEKKCGIEDFIEALSPDPPDPRAPQATQQMLETLREPERANHILSDIYQLELKVWQAFAAARSFLLVCGLIYPDAGERKLALFKQFLSLPADPVWPHREDPAAGGGSYARRPTTPAEDPALPLPYPDRSLDWLLHVGLDNEASFGEVVLSALRGLRGNGEDRVNFDLDADRWRLHPAWGLVPGDSIADQPLAVVVLPFEEQ